VSSLAPFLSPPAHCLLSALSYVRDMDKVDATMSAVNEQRELANEIAEAISNPMYGDGLADDVSIPAYWLTLSVTMSLFSFRRMS
jgi:hypothetical protein